MCGQSAAARRTAMSRVSLVLLLCACACTRATIIADQPTLSDRLDKLYEKLEKFSPRTTQPAIPDSIKFYEGSENQTPTTERIDKLYEKLDRLNSLTPDRFLSDDDEELLDALQEWGMLDDYVGATAKDLQRLKSDSDAEDEYEDLDLADDDYAMDDGEDLEPEDKESSSDKDSTTDKTLKLVTPSALNRLERVGTALSAMSGTTAGSTRYVADSRTKGRPQVEQETTVVSATDSIAATKERPRILDDTLLTASERASVRSSARVYLSTMVSRSKCQMPQPRWLPVRHMAPAADTLYRPTCVLLHRCAADSGCCHNEEQVCAPIEGQYVIIPLFLRKPDGLSVARMQFFNHTRCACVSQETMQEVRRPPRRHQEIRRENHSQENYERGNHSQDNHVENSQDKHTLEIEERKSENQEDRVASAGNANQSDWPTQEPKLDTDTAAPPQLRRCTCPTLFIARAADTSCACVCDWQDPQRRRDCLSLSRGREHFGMRDRVCVSNGDCNPPSCEYGAYERNNGKCPLKRYRRLRFTSRRYLDRTLA